MQSVIGQEIYMLTSYWSRDLYRSLLLVKRFIMQSVIGQEIYIVTSYWSRFSYCNMISQEITDVFGDWSYFLAGRALIC